MGLYDMSKHNDAITKAFLTDSCPSCGKPPIIYPLIAVHGHLHLSKMTTVEIEEVVLNHESGGFTDVLGVDGKWYSVGAPDWNFHEYIYRAHPEGKVKR